MFLEDWKITSNKGIPDGPCHGQRYHMANKYNWGVDLSRLYLSHSHHNLFNPFMRSELL